MIVPSRPAVLRAAGLLLALGTAPLAVAPGQPAAFRYQSDQFGCAGFGESVRTVILPQGADPMAAEGAGRRGILMVRGTPAADGTDLTLWYRELEVWRDLGHDRLAPDTDGLIGGRWRGRLGPLGPLVLDARPFMPPDVLTAADLSNAPADWLPALPEAALAVDDTVETDLGERTIWRPSDSSGVRRLAWRSDRIRSAVEPVFLTERVREAGAMAWDPSAGPMAWHRTVTVDAEARRGGAGGRVARTRLTQQIDVIRITDAGCSDASLLLAPTGMVK